jgi:hypothetical protein
MARPEITGQKIADADEAFAYELPEFCRLHRMSMRMFYKLKAEGRAPRIKYLGRKPIITREAAREWRMAD